MKTVTYFSLSISNSLNLEPYLARTNSLVPFEFSIERVNCNFFLLDFKLVAEKRECTGSWIEQGYQKTIQHCYDACKRKASMFTYGLAPERCSDQGCKCWCATSSKNGKCTMSRHPNFNLYAYTLLKTGE